MNRPDRAGNWRCPDCQHDNLSESRFCEVCGKRRGADEPGPGPEVMARLRGARASQDQPEAGRRVKLRFLDFGERVRAMFRRPPQGQRGRSRASSASPLVLVFAFALWAFIRLVGYYPLLLLLKFVAFLFTPLGLPVWLLLAWYYSRHRRAIHRTVQGVFEQLQMLAGVAAKVLDSISLLRGGMASLLGREQNRRGRDGDTASRRAAVRILQEEWNDDEDDDDGYDEPSPPSRRLG